jgi:NIPSNAP
MKIYELTTIELVPGAAVHHVTEPLQRQLGERSDHLLGVWTTEIGGVNDVVVLHRYEINDLAATTSNAFERASWFHPLSEMIVDIQADQFCLFPYVKDPEPGTYGPLYEMRSYLFRPGRLDELIESWREPLKLRVELSPAPLVMYATTGPLLKFVHIWPYADFADRAKVRQRSASDGIWPPKNGPSRLLKQDSSLLTPTPFSPMK